MAKVEVVGYCTKGCWTVALLADGEIYLTSSYRTKANYGFRLTGPDHHLSPSFPKYLHELVKEAWGFQS